MPEEIRMKLVAIYNTLDDLQVVGRKNAEKLVGCMMTIEGMLNTSQKNNEKEE